MLNIIIDVNSVNYEHWSYNASCIEHSKFKLCILNSIQFEILSKDQNKIIIPKIISKNYLIRTVSQFLIYLSLFNRPYVKKIEILHASQILIFYINILNFFYKKNVIVHLHNDLIDAFNSFNTTNIIKCILYRLAFLINAVDYISQNKYYKLYLYLFISKKIAVKAMNEHPKLTNQFISHINYNKSFEFKSGLIYLGSENVSRGYEIYSRFGTIKSYNLFDKYQRNDIFIYINEILNNDMFIVMFKGPAYRLGTSGVFSDILIKDNNFSIYYGHKLPLYYKLKYKHINFQSLNTISQGCVLIIRFGKIGDIILAVLLSKIYLNKKIYILNINYNQELSDFLFRHHNITVVNNTTEIRNIDFYAVHIFSHPDESIKKKIYIQYLLCNLKYSHLTYSRSKYQYNDVVPLLVNEKHNYKIITFAPISAEKSKDIDFIYINRIVEYLLSMGYIVNLLCERKIPITNQINLNNYSGITNLEQAVDILKASDIFIGVDSGLAHISYFYQIKSYIIYSSRLNNLYWKPKSQINYYYNDTIHCKGCNMVNCPYGVPTCINNEKLLSEIKQFMNKISNEKR